jgi:hypothetical protein
MIEELKRAAGSSVLETHPHYRTAIGLIGVSLPPILMLASLLGFLETRDLQNSISAYYWADSCANCYRYGTRDVFVGTLFVIGVFLFFYTYTPQHGGAEARTAFAAVRKGFADAWLGKIAGVAAVCVALLPTDPRHESIPAPIAHMDGQCSPSSARSSSINSRRRVFADPSPASSRCCGSRPR